MKRTFSPSLRRILACLLLTAIPAFGEDLRPREDLDVTVFRGDGAPRPYLRLLPGDRATYLFCGQGELAVLSRAVMTEPGTRARYLLETSLDGARPGTELAHRVVASSRGTFDQRFPAGPLRRETFSLARGCHTVVVSLLRTTADAVAVRLTWDEQAPTRRRWREPTSVQGGSDALLQVGDTESAYRRLEPGAFLELDVDGPAWVRLLARPTGQPGAMRYGLTIERRNRPYRQYLLDNEPSGRASLAGATETPIGRANEVVFAVGAGRQRLRVATPANLVLLVRAQVAPRERGRQGGTEPSSWRFVPRISSYYDDNILRYSQRFLDRFDAGQDPDRFRVSSLDDWIHRADLYLDRRFAGIGGRDATLELDFEHRAYQRNSIKDWSRVGLAWQQRLAEQRSVRVAVRHTPDFYVRHLRDSDLTGGNATADPFQAFAFEVTDATTSFTHQLGTTFDARYHLGGGRYRHSRAFREFDSTNLFAGARLNQQLTPRLRLSYALELTESDARGYDQAGETRATSDDTDPSYRQLDLVLSARWRFPGARRHTLFLQAERGARDYTTDKPGTLAPLHAGRDDTLLRLYASWQLNLSPRYQLTVFAQARDRSSSAPIRLDIGVEKDYEQREAGLRLSMRFGGR